MSEVMDEYLFFQLTPENYVGHETHPVHITVHVKESYLAVCRPIIESYLRDAIAKIEGATDGQ